MVGVNRRPSLVASFNLPPVRPPQGVTPVSPAIPKVPDPDLDPAAALREYPTLGGLDPRARGPLLSAVHPARVSFTLQNIPESSGMHLAEPDSEHTAAVDIYVGDMTHPEVRALLDRLGLTGFAAWYRIPGQDGWPSRYGPHVHAVYAGVPLKPGLRRQVRDYLKGRNGLRSHSPYTFHRHDPEALETVRRLFHPKYTPTSKRSRRSRSSH